MATTRKIGIIGKGNVGSALARGLKRAGHDVRAVGKDESAMQETAAWSEIVLFAVPFGAVDDVVRGVGEALAGKTVIDVTNALDASMNLAVGFTTSGAEELQKKLPKARVAKLSMREVRTAKVAADWIERFGYEVSRNVGKTGVVGVLRNGAGPTVMLRADMMRFP